MIVIILQIQHITYYKNYNENIIMNKVNFEDIFSFERYSVNKLNDKHESSVLLKRNITNNEIIIYNIINSKEYNEKLMNMLISIISEKEFGIYVKLHNNYIGISNFKYLFYFYLIISISIFFGIKMKISFDERISKLKHIVYLNGTNPFFYWLGLFVFDLIIIFIFSIILYIFNQNFLVSLNTFFFFIAIIFFSYICGFLTDKFEYSFIIFFYIMFMMIYLIILIFCEKIH